jgi:exosortase/archaeosortase family protein
MGRDDRLRFSLIVLALLGLVLLTPRAPVLGGALAPLDFFTARATATLLRVCGMDVSRADAVLTHPSGFAFEIYWRCTGLLPAVFLAGLILASPGGLLPKLAGVAVGVGVVLTVNLLRLVSLFLLGVRQPGLFPFAHAVLWEAVVVLLIVGLWTVWMRWAESREEAASRASP